MYLSGELLLGAARVAGGAGTVRAMNPATGEWLDPQFTLASRADVARACELAGAAFDVYRETAPEARAAWLEAEDRPMRRVGNTDLFEYAGRLDDLPRHLDPFLSPVPLRGHPCPAQRLHPCRLPSPLLPAPSPRLRRASRLPPLPMRESISS